jgi:hypothetical protein
VLTTQHQIPQLRTLTTPQRAIHLWPTTRPHNERERMTAPTTPHTAFSTTSNNGFHVPHASQPWCKARERRRE